MMKRAERTKLLIEVGRELALQLAANICEQYDVQEISPPKEGLVMIKMRETAQKSLFYIGEVLVTETKVKIGNHYGIGLVKESEPELSKALAIIDAAYEAQLPETILWIPHFEALAQQLHINQQQIKRSIERTKVNFDTMAT
ncbi:phosphonate C-P lyase system protein PhnG [Bacillus ndiopicus]|uniref:phosphonate C-P lyase system protein PhnG n=1 Tax=Bacillus ndiopicus TaxID=1347368 RepID=UPI000A41ADB7|nr:phosphonate C-P lyase system protein PhnG [Bacillus ndiopicus]